MKTKRSRMLSILLAVCFVAVLFINPATPMLGVAAADGLEEFLAGNSDGSFTVSDDITLQSVTVGANHTINIPEGKTVSIGNLTLLQIPDGKKLTVQGKGTLDIWILQANKGIVVNGTLSINGGLKFIANASGYGDVAGLKINSAGTFQSENCDITLQGNTINTTNGAAIYSEGALDIQGGSFKIENGNESTTGLMSFGSLNMDNVNPLEIKNQGRSTTGMFLWEDSKITNSNITIANIQPDGNSNSGIAHYAALKIEKSTVTFKSSNGSIGAASAFKHSGDLTFKECDINIETTATSHYSSSDNGSITYADSTVKVFSNMSFVNSLSGTKVYVDDGDDSSKTTRIILEEGAKLEGFKMCDRGVPVTKTSEITVKAENAPVSANDLSAGTYIWDGTYFSKTAPVEWQDLQANGTQGTVNTTELTLTFDKDPGALSIDDITVTGAQKVTLSGADAKRILTISRITVGEGENVTVEISRAGYIFTPNSQTVAVHKKLIRNFTVTFDPNGGIRTSGGFLTQAVDEGEAASAPILTRSGYTFNGWDKAFSTVTSDMTIKAVWKLNESPSNGGSTSSGSSTTITGTTTQSSDGTAQAAAQIDRSTASSADYVKVTLGDHSVRLSSSIVNNLLKTNSDAKLEIKQSASSDATKANFQLAAENGALVPVASFDFNASVVSGGSTTSVHELGGNVTVTVKLTTEQIKQLKDQPSAKLYYYDETSGKFTDMGAVFNLTTGMVTFTTSHFSTYVIAVNKSLAAGAARLDDSALLRKDYRTEMGTVVIDVVLLISFGGLWLIKREKN